MQPPEKIEKTKLLLVEGLDPKLFFIQACLNFSVSDIQVLDFGGISDLTKYLKMLRLLPGYDTVTTFGIIRDAEKNASSAIESIKSSLRQVSLPVPNQAFEFSSAGNPRVVFMILPGIENTNNGVNTLQQGALEDLLLEIARDRTTCDCVDDYISCLQSRCKQIQNLHKVKLHSYLSGISDYCGLKIGEASKAGAWDWTHSSLDKFRNIITKM